MSEQIPETGKREVSDMDDRSAGSDAEDSDCPSLVSSADVSADEDEMECRLTRGGCDGGGCDVRKNILEKTEVERTQNTGDGGSEEKVLEKVETSPGKSYDAVVDLWNSINELEMDQEVERIRVQVVGVFVLGLATLYPDCDMWFKAMVDVGTVESRERLSSLSAMNRKYYIVSELFCDMFDITREVFYSPKREMLKDMLELVDKIERMGMNGKQGVQEALAQARQYPFFVMQLTRLSQLQRMPKFRDEVCSDFVHPMAMEFSVLFHCKMVHYHVMYYARHKELLSAKIAREMMSGAIMDPGSDVSNPENGKVKGNELYWKGEYREAIDVYTKAMKQDFDNCYLYGNRAQCYINLEEYLEALSDCRRAILANRKWYKGYYRAAEASLKLGDPHNEAKRFAQQSRLNLMHIKGALDQELLKQIDELEDKINQFHEETENKLMIEKTKKEVEEYLRNPDKRCSCACTCSPEVRKARIEFEVLKARHLTSTTPELQRLRLELQKPLCLEEDKGKCKAEGNAAASAQQQLQQSAPQPYEPTEVEKFQTNLREGLEAVNLHNSLRAFGKYSAAVNLWNRNASVRSFMDSKGMMAVHYAHGINAVSQDDIRGELLEGLHIFQSMYREEMHRSFPLVHYGLCRALMAVYRFLEALEVAVKAAVTKAMRKTWKPVCWPLSEQVIRESNLEVFEEEMEKMRKQCRYPPSPEGMCYEHVDSEEAKAIYIESPTYGGHVTMRCYLKCCFKFHVTCWKAYKSKFPGDKLSDKDLVDKDCPTPDCGSFICFISVKKANKRPVEFPSIQQPVRPPRRPKPEKVKPSSQRTIARRLERKELRRLKKEEARRAACLPESPSQQDEEKEEMVLAAAAMPPTDSLVLLSKEKEDDCSKYNSFQKTVKQKKKKEKKEKAVVNVEVNFTDNPDRERVGGYDLEEEEEEEEERTATVTSEPWVNEQKSITVPASTQVVREYLPPPPPPKKQVESFSKIVASLPSQNPSQSKKDETIKKTLTMLLHDILQEEGPQRLRALPQHDMMQDIPEEAIRIIKQCGGLRLYFENNYEFVVRGDVVGIRKDIDKVERLADSVGLASAGPSNSYHLNSDSSNSNQLLLGNVGKTKNAWENGSISASVNTSKTAVSQHYSENVESREMTLPKISQGLNPSAPEFQPLQGKPAGSRMNDIDDIELGTSPKESACSKPCVSGGMDDLDSFTTAVADDSDAEDTPSSYKSVTTHSLDVNDIDEVDLEPAAAESDPYLEDVAPLPSAQDGMSQRSSQSDLSQAGSDLSTGLLYRTASPSSSVSSSHRNTRDVGSPFSMRDTGSPALSHTARGGDFTRQSGSPVGNGGPLGTERVNSERSPGPGLTSSSVATPAHPLPGSGMISEDSTGVGFSSIMDPIQLPSVNLPPAPKPLKPLAPLGGSTSRLIAGSAAVGGGNVSARSTAAGSVSAAPFLSDSVDMDTIEEKTSLSAFMSSAATNTAVNNTADLISAQSLSSSCAVPSSSSGLNAEAPLFQPVLPEKGNSQSTFPSLAGQDTSTYGRMAGEPELSSSRLATAFTPSLTLGLPSPILTSSYLGMTTSEEMASSSTLTPSLSVSSALVSEFKPLTLSQYFSSSSSSTSQVLPSFSSNPWSATSSYLGGDTWSSNSFPSAIRPDEPVAMPVLTYGTDLPPQSTPSTSVSSSFLYSNSPWSVTDNSLGVESRSLGVAAQVDKASQTVGVETRSVEVSTELTQQQLIVMQMQQETLNELAQEKCRLLFRLEQLQQQLKQSEEDRQAGQREVVEQRNDLKKAVQQMENMEINNQRLKEEQALRENQLMSELHALQQKSHLSSMETASLLQKCQAVEEKAKQERQRAMQAEIRVVQEQMQNFKLMLRSKVMEVDHCKKEFVKCVLNWERNNHDQRAPEQQVKDILDYYNQAKDAFARTLESVLGQLNDQMQQIQTGKSLSELEPVTNPVPQLPPPPEGLKIGPSGQPIFIPNVSEAHPVNSHPVPMARETSLESGASVPPMPSRSMAGTPPGMSQMPAPLRPPMPGSRPPGIPLSTGLGMSKLGGASLGSVPQNPSAPGEATSVRGPMPPLRPIGSLGKGLAGGVLRPSPPLAPNKGGQPHTTAGPDSAGALAAPKQSSFDRLVTCLQKSFPNCDRETFHQCIQEMRRARNGSLSGLDLDYIVRHVTQMLIARGYRPNKAASMTNGNASSTTTSTTSNGWGMKRTAPPPGISPVWSVEGLEPADPFVEEEDPCAICTDELSLAPVQTLDCSHRFHDECIRTWFKEQTTCPKCRQHAPLQEDFPMLK